MSTSKQAKALGKVGAEWAQEPTEAAAEEQREQPTTTNIAAATQAPPAPTKDTDEQEPTNTEPAPIMRAQTRSARVNLLITPAAKKEATARAKKIGITFNEYVNQLIEIDLAKARTKAN